MGPAQPEVDGLACLVQFAEDVIEPVAPLLVSPLPVATTTVRWALRLGRRAMSGHGRPVVSGLLGGHVADQDGNAPAGLGCRSYSL